MSGESTAVNLHISLQEMHSESGFRPLSVPQQSTFVLHSIYYVYKSFFKRLIQDLTKKTFTLNLN